MTTLRFGLATEIAEQLGDNLLTEQSFEENTAVSCIAGAQADHDGMCFLGRMGVNDACI